MDNFDEIRHSELYQSYKSGANWFYWIAGLTLITSIIAVGGGDWRFLISLGTTQFIDAMAIVLSEQLGEATKVIALVLDIVVTALFVFFGVMAGKKHLWAYLLGVIVFGLDGLVSLMIGDLIGVLAHAFVLFFTIRGYMAGRELLAFEREMAQQPPPPPAVESPATAPSI
ncbi:MAG TPA: hypothetical protein VHH35_14565 [Pyrinomonadaceae bacterium]|nr:hypothetical protein [Pyrinomonadaceae bacterium]